MRLYITIYRVRVGGGGAIRQLLGGILFSGISYALLYSERFPAVANSVVVWTLLAGGVAIRSPLFLKILLCNDLTFMLSIFRPFHIVNTFRKQQLRLQPVNIFS